jgi:tetratricopeptide (TPR) repeat protein
MARARVGRTLGPRDPENPERIDGLNARLRNEAERAVRLAPSLADAHAALGYLKFQAGDEAAAMAPLRRALLLSPNLADAHDVLGRIMIETDRDEGSRHLRSALTLEPENEQGLAALARHQYLMGDRDGAIGAVESHANRDAFLPVLARFAIWTRDVALAREVLARDIPEPTIIQRTSREFLELVAHGKPVDLTQIEVSPDLISPRLASFFGQLRAEVAMFSGDRERALSELDASSKMALFDCAWLRRCTLFDPLRGDPAFEAASARVEARADKVVAAYRAPLVVEKT